MLLPTNKFGAFINYKNDEGNFAQFVSSETFKQNSSQRVPLAAQNILWFQFLIAADRTALQSGDNLDVFLAKQPSSFGVEHRNGRESCRVQLQMAGTSNLN